MENLKKGLDICTFQQASKEISFLKEIPLQCKSSKTVEQKSQTNSGFRWAFICAKYCKFKNKTKKEKTQQEHNYKHSKRSRNSELNIYLKDQVFKLKLVSVWSRRGQGNDKQRHFFVISLPSESIEILQSRTRSRCWGSSRDHRQLGQHPIPVTVTTPNPFSFAILCNKKRGFSEVLEDDIFDET